jgi:hypothetical protein
LWVIHVDFWHPRHVRLRGNLGNAMSTFLPFEGIGWGVINAPWITAHKKAPEPSPRGFFVQALDQPRRCRAMKES